MQLCCKRKKRQCHLPISTTSFKLKELLPPTSVQTDSNKEVNPARGARRRCRGCKSPETLLQTRPRSCAGACRPQPPASRYRLPSPLLPHGLLCSGKVAASLWSFAGSQLSCPPQGSLQPMRPHRSALDSLQVECPGLSGYPLIAESSHRLEEDHSVLMRSESEVKKYSPSTINSAQSIRVGIIADHSCTILTMPNIGQKQ